jgi:pimeloyl-ACP methyl ester carboxylesterase
MTAALQRARRGSWRLRCGAAGLLAGAAVSIPAVAWAPAGEAAGTGALACPGQSSHNTAVTAGDFARVDGAVPRPVVLVHGWDSGYSAMQGYANLLDTSKVLREPLHAFLFDYSANSAHWAATPAIASCLADYVNTLSAAYREAGGDGKVLAVGHSMGGLAIRFSASAQYAADPDGASLGGVVTLDTPSLGSPWGDLPAAQLQQDWTQFKNGNGLQGMLPWPPGSDAQVCLATHFGSTGLPAGCATPSWLPPGVPLAEIAGDITVHRQVFGFDVADTDIKGDAVVSTASSLGYLPDSGPGTPPVGTAAPATYVDACEVTSGQLEAGVGGLGISVLDSLESALEYVGTLGDQPLSSPFGTLLTLADLTAPCGHTHVNNPLVDPFASLDVLKALNADLSRLSAEPAGTPVRSGYFRYTNLRFKFSFDVPDGYTAGPPPEDGDGLSFSNGTGSASVAGYGQNWLGGITPSKDLAFLASSYASSGDQVTLRYLNGDTAAVSGTTPQGTIFYERDVVFPEVVYSLVWGYPAADQSQYGPLVDHTAGSFAPGPDHGD